MPKPLPNRAELLQALEYEPLTGALIWREAPGKQSHLLGKPAGTMRTGYTVVSLKRSSWQAHRLIWLMVYGEDPGPHEIDHINGDRSDNRLINLRLATAAQNRQNSSARRGRQLPKGVKKNKGRYGARITCEKTVHWLGTYDTPEEAHEAYRKAANALHGEFAGPTTVRPDLTQPSCPIASASH